MARKLLFVLPLTLVACDGVGFDWDDLLNESDSDWETDDGFYQDAPQIAQVDYRCDNGAPDSWWYQVTLDGWAGDMWLDIYETGDGNWPGNPNAVWEESHPLRSVDYDESGAWDVWEVRVNDVEAISQQIGGNSTLFSCNWDDGRSLAFMVSLWDENANYVECAIWGHESDPYFNDYRGNDCLCFEADGNCNN